MYTNKEIWNVTYPIFLGLLAQNVINVTDTAFLGHVGEVALGAAAMGGLLYICVYTVAFGFSVGSQILIARRNGEGNFHAIGPVMWQGTAIQFGDGSSFTCHIAGMCRTIDSSADYFGYDFLCYIRVFYMAYLGISFCLCQCHVPCALYSITKTRY